MSNCRDKNMRTQSKNRWGWAALS